VQQHPGKAAAAACKLLLMSFIVHGSQVSALPTVQRTIEIPLPTPLLWGRPKEAVPSPHGCHSPTVGPAPTIGLGDSLAQQRRHLLEDAQGRASLAKTQDAARMMGDQRQPNS